MAVTFQLPSELEKNLRHDVCDLDARAKEALLVALYRQGKLTQFSLSQALGIDRIEADDLLHRHGVTEDLGSTEDYLADARTLENIRANP